MLADSAAGFYYWVTLHDATGGFVNGDTYTAGIHGELPSAYGYVQGGKALDLTHVGGTGGVLDGADVTWSISGGDITASFAATWVSTTNDITTAKLLSVDDSSADPQTTTDGNLMTYTVTNPITIPTPV
jgi:hypothetical protein